MSVQDFSSCVNGVEREIMSNRFISTQILDRLDLLKECVRAVAILASEIDENELVSQCLKPVSDVLMIRCDELEEILLSEYREFS